MAGYYDNWLQRQAFISQMKDDEAKRGLLGQQMRGSPYRSRLLLGDMAMQDNPTPNYMQVPGGSPMPEPSPALGLGSIGQTRNLMAMGADPLAMIQGQMASRSAMNAPYTLNPGDVRMAGNKQVASAPFAPAKPAGPESALGKLDADLKAGLITKAQYDAAVKKENYIAPGPQESAPTGYRWTNNGTELEIIKGGPADVGQKGLPQKYKDQTSALDQMDSAINDYEKILNEVGTEYWNAEKAAQLESLETQMKFGIKGIEQTGALDKGSVDVMGGMIPSSTGWGANLNPRGAARSKALTKEMKKYTQRARSAINLAYNASGSSQGTQSVGSTASIDDLVAKYRSK